MKGHLNTKQQRLLLDFITDFDTIFDKSYLNKYN